MKKHIKSLISLLVITVLYVQATIAAPTLMYSTKDFSGLSRAAAVFLAPTSFGAISVYISKTPLNADVRISFTKNLESADIIVDDDAVQRGGLAVCFPPDDGLTGGTRIYFSVEPLGAKNVYIADSGAVDLLVCVKKWDGSLKQLIAALIALKKL